MIRRIRALLRREGYELATTRGRWETFGATRLTTRGYFVHMVGKSVRVGWTPGFTPGQPSPRAGPGVWSGHMQKVIWMLRGHGYWINDRGWIDSDR